MCSHEFKEFHTQLRNYYYHKYSDKIKNSSLRLKDLLN